MVSTGQVASAATPFSGSGLYAVVSGSSVTGAVTIASASPVNVAVATICVRNDGGQNFDFSGSTARITPSGVTLTKTGTFPAGSYTYWGCVYSSGTWFDLGSHQSFTVGGATAGTTRGAASGVAMPKGNLSGWNQTYAEDFNTPVAYGAFPGPYAGTLMSYSGFSDAFHTGFFDQSIISVQNGALDIYLHTQNGRALGAAPIPLVNGQWGGQTYGKFSVRMRADALDGYGTGFLLWPDSGNTSDGEIDFPESGLSEGAKGYNHCLRAPTSNCMVVETNYQYSAWHTYSIEWTPKQLRFLIDDAVVGSTSNNIPSRPLHWVMQVATHGTPSASTAGHLLIDWATIYSYAG